MSAFANAQSGAQKSSSQMAVSEPLRSLQEKVSAQGKRIDYLEKQVAQLRAMVEEGHLANSSAKGSSPAAMNGGRHIEKAQPVAANGELTHKVTKGETLALIARQYKVSVADLEKTNKIADERKLQIGQVLIIPTPRQPQKPQ